LQFLFFFLDVAVNPWYKPGKIERENESFNPSRKEVIATMKQCTLCNEHIEDVDFEFGEAVDLEGECWHAECYYEYFGEVLETV